MTLPPPPPFKSATTFSMCCYNKHQAIFLGLTSDAAIHTKLSQIFVPIFKAFY